MILRFFLCCAPKALCDDAAKAGGVTVTATIAIKNIMISALRCADYGTVISSSSDSSHYTPEFLAH